MSTEPGRGCIVFDLDGTLIDSVPDLAAALNRLMDAHRLPGFSAAAVTAMVGDGAAVLVSRAFAARGIAPPDDAVMNFVADYSAHAAEATRPFDGARETLALLRAAGWRLAVCTNKPAVAARAVLAALGLADFFASVGGGDSFPTRKPDPAHLLATLAAAGAGVDRAVMVGDHANDVAAARGAGIPCVFAGWGYGTAAMAEGAFAVADRFADIPSLASQSISSAGGAAAGASGGGAAAGRGAAG